MESSLNISTHEESSKIESEKGQNDYINIISNRLSVQNNNHIIQNKLKDIINAQNELSNNKIKLNETLPVKNNIPIYKFKIVLIGNISVGKSSIIKRFVNNEFDEEYVCTIGTELSKKSLLVSQNKMLELFIWDTGGQEKYRSITRQYYAKAHTILLVFDLTSEKAFDDLQSLYEEALEYINDAKCMFFLLGNKSDLKEEIKINEEDIRAFMKKNQKIKQYFEVSALNGHNIDLSFDKIGNHLLSTYEFEKINMDVYKNLYLKIKKNDNDANKEKCC
jgi:small GTP-binding protein